MESFMLKARAQRRDACAVNDTGVPESITEKWHLRRTVLGLAQGPPMCYVYLYRP